MSTKDSVKIQILKKYPEAKDAAAIGISVGDILCNHVDCLLVVTEDIIKRITQTDLDYYFVIGNVGNGYHYSSDIYMKNQPAPSTQPRTKVEYVKVEFETAWEAIQSFEINDDLYYKASSLPSWEKMRSCNMKEVIDYTPPIKLYRRIETEINERDEFIEKCGKIWSSHSPRSTSVAFGDMYDSGCRFVDK